MIKYANCSNSSFKILPKGNYQKFDHLKFLFEKLFHWKQLCTLIIVFLMAYAALFQTFLWPKRINRVTSMKTAVKLKKKISMFGKVICFTFANPTFIGRTFMCMNCTCRHPYIHTLKHYPLPIFHYKMIQMRSRCIRIVCVYKI